MVDTTKLKTEVQADLDAVVGGTSDTEMLKIAKAAEGLALDRTIFDAELQTRITALAGSESTTELLKLSKSLEVVGGSFYGKWPVLAAADNPASVFDGYANQNRVEGFLADGDYIDLPQGAAATATIEYFNSAGVSQWSYDVSDIDANAENFVGWVLDAGLLYVVVVNETGPPNIYTTKSVNAAGTITAIGTPNTISPTVDFTTPTGDWGQDSISSVGCTTMYREPRATGNLFIRQNNSTGMEEMEINIATGAIVSDPAIVDAGARFDYPAYKTSDGIYAYWASSALHTFSIDDGGYQAMSTGATDATIAVGMPTIATSQMQQINDKLYLVSHSTSNPTTDPSRWLISDYETWVKAMRATTGVGV